MTSDAYPSAADPDAVGSYDAVAGAGGGYVWDAVLEYRVWCHPADGTNDFYYAFATHHEAQAYADRLHGTEGAHLEIEEPLALIVQEEYIEEPHPGEYVHVRARRLTEWPPEFLFRPRRTPHTIPDFLSPDAPANRLDILRGLATGAHDEQR